ncbi:DUF1460 domain-containing protein [Candidatus Desantisbacteria bacterium]|nr:DUF1460 domain-containing protein [Candidatus Desantisbacteria bacterium]
MRKKISNKIILFFLIIILTGCSTLRKERKIQYSDTKIPAPAFDTSISGHTYGEHFLPDKKEKTSANNYNTTGESPLTQHLENEFVDLGKWDENKLNELISMASKINEIDKRIDFLSAQFLDTQYKGSTLIGDINIPEIFVIRFDGVDCFTYLDYIEAMRRSISYNDFKENLKKVRYQNAIIAYDKRNHFFTDWKEFNPEYIEDVTLLLGREKTKQVVKILNLKNDSTFLLPGIIPKKRIIDYIPSSQIDNSVINEIKTGDYAGIYTDDDGLDVSHVGLLIKRENNIILRHSTIAKKFQKVVDIDFIEYISKRPGFIILRPVNFRPVNKKMDNAIN